MKLGEYRNIDLIYKGKLELNQHKMSYVNILFQLGHTTTFKSELQKMIGTCQTVQDKDRVIEELIRYNVILKEEHCKMSDDKQDLIRNLDRITAQCEKMQLEKKQVVQR